MARSHVCGLTLLAYSTWHLTDIKSTRDVLSESRRRWKWFGLATSLDPIKSSTPQAFFGVILPRHQRERSQAGSFGTSGSMPCSASWKCPESLIFFLDSQPPFAGSYSSLERPASLLPLRHHSAIAQSSGKCVISQHPSIPRARHRGRTDLQPTVLD